MSCGVAGTSACGPVVNPATHTLPRPGDRGVPECSRMRIAPFLMALMLQNKCFTLPLIFRETAWDLGSDRPFP